MSELRARTVGIMGSYLGKYSFDGPVRLHQFVSGQTGRSVQQPLDLVEILKQTKPATEQGHMAEAVLLPSRLMPQVLEDEFDLVGMRYQVHFERYVRWLVFVPTISVEHRFRVGSFGPPLGGYDPTQAQDFGTELTGPGKKMAGDLDRTIFLDPYHVPPNFPTDNLVLKLMFAAARPLAEIIARTELHKLGEGYKREERLWVYVTTAFAAQYLVTLTQGYFDALRQSPCPNFKTMAWLQKSLRTWDRDNSFAQGKFHDAEKSVLERISFAVRRGPE